MIKLQNSFFFFAIYSFTKGEAQQLDGAINY